MFVWITDINKSVILLSWVFEITLSLVPELVWVSTSPNKETAEADRHNRLPGSPVMCGIWGNGWGGVPLLFEHFNFLISNRHTDCRESLIFLKCFWNSFFSCIFKILPEKN